MKVAGSGSPRTLTIRVQRSEIRLWREALCRRLAAGSSDADRVVAHLLQRAHDPVPSGQPCTLVGPTDVLGPLVHAVAEAAHDAYVSAWRQFRDGTLGDAIVATRSPDGGSTFSGPGVVASVNPFDQGTTDTSFRTNGFPTLAIDGGVPSMTGARLPATTSIENGPSADFATPSEAVMLMPVYRPACAVVGVPEMRPVLESNVSQAGLFAIVNESVSPSVSPDCGVNE